MRCFLLFLPLLLLANCQPINEQSLSDPYGLEHVISGLAPLTAGFYHTFEVFHVRAYFADAKRRDNIAIRVSFCPQWVKVNDDHLARSIACAGSGADTELTTQVVSAPSGIARLETDVASGAILGTGPSLGTEVLLVTATVDGERVIQDAQVVISSFFSPNNVHVGLGPDGQMLSPGLNNVTPGFHALLTSSLNPIFFCSSGGVIVPPLSHDGEWSLNLTSDTLLYTIDSDATQAQVYPITVMSQR